jgi:hypothetical protein
MNGISLAVMPFWLARLKMLLIVPVVVVPVLIAPAGLASVLDQVNAEVTESREK